MLLSINIVLLGYINSFILVSILLILHADLEWKLIYVGSAEDETYDQQLESVLVGPVNVGNYRFVLQVLPPALTSKLFFTGFSLCADQICVMFSTAKY